LVLLGQRHPHEPDIAQTTTVLAGWSRAHVQQLSPFGDRYGAIPSDHPARLNRALMTGPGSGATGTLLDVHDASLMVLEAEMAWTIVHQGAKALHDDELVERAGVAREDLKRAMRWFRTMIELQAPETLSVPGDESPNGAPFL
jgi:hypothetical protein